MAGERLTGSDKRALLLWVAAGILGVLFAYKYFFQAFPEASVHLQVTREEALARAQKFVAGLGENVTGYRSAVVFDVDDGAKVYLERQLGLQEANRLMSSELKVWYWEVRFFKPQQEEEFRVNVSPAGQIVRYSRRVEESRAGGSLDRAAAQTAAQNYLRARLGMDLSGWDALPEEANSNKRPNRTDWSFTWEKHGFRAKDAPYRLEVTVQGDRIGSSQEYLKVPEAWERSYERLRSGNDTLALYVTVPYILLLAIAVWLGIRLTKHGQTRWRGAILLGLVVVAMLVLQNLNDWPHWGASYNTNDSYSMFIAMKIAGALLVAVLSALTVSLVLPAAEPLYRASQPEHMRLSRAFTLRGLRSKEFFSAAVVGLSMAAAHIGYVVAFYLVATKLGAWAPQELNFDNSFNTAFPWISGAAIGLYAATNEEFTFRLFAIPFLNRFTHSRWIAVIVPAFLWGFLHSNYPQEPAYTRGIEIGIVGVIAGLVMLRWGIVATLIWHYTVDASLVGLLLVRSNSLYFKISGVVVGAAALMPLAFGCFSYLKRGGFETDEELLNRSQRAPEFDVSDEPEAATAELSSRRYDALAPGMLAFLAVCLLAGGVLAWRLKPESLGDYLKLSVDAKGARARADEIMRKGGLDPNAYNHATVFVSVSDAITNEFLRQHIGISRLNEIYATKVAGAVWQVRYFRDGQTEEYSIKLKPDGSLLAFHHRLAEDAPGASLSKEEAVAKAEKFLREERKIDLSQWSLVEAQSDKRHHRVDHELTWQQNAPLDAGVSSHSDATGHAYVRVKVAVLGDEVTDYRGSYYPKPDDREELEQKLGETLWTFIKIPADWRRKQEEQTLPRGILNIGIPILFFAGLGITAVVIFLKNLRSEAARSIPWKRLALWAVWGLVSFYVVFALGDRIRMAMNAYNSAIPLKTTFGILGILALLGGPFNFGLLVALFGGAWYYAKVAFGEERVPGWRGMPAAYYRDALWIGLGGAAGLLGLEQFLTAVAAHWPTAHRSFEISFGQNFDAFVPAASIVGGTVGHSLRTTGIVAAIACFVAARVRQPGLRILLFLLGALSLVGGDWGSPADFLKEFLTSLILLGALVFGVRRVMRFNLLGCFLVVAGTSLFGDAVELLAQLNSFYRDNGYAVLLALCLLFTWPLAAWRFGPPTLGAEGSSSGASA
ncbi:MAG TPA: CPBP family intramembrane glutamic endopeptidase [Candidatus Acidoferrum sp.]|nr:CPBP family intramembrane glutamic endopeptidase [Candidatus Acidoferrum sp.]